MKLIVELEHFHHEALNSKRREIPSQERPSYPPILWGRPCVAYNMYQWTERIQRRRTREQAIPPPAESMRASDVICCSFDSESCVVEASRLRGF
jgi:hypothetical protein